MKIKKFLLKILIFTLMCIALCFVSACKSKDESKKETSGQENNDESGILLADFEKWAPDFQLFNLSYMFGKVSRNEDGNYANGNYSAKIQPLGSYVETSSPTLFLATYSEIYDFDNSDFAGISAVTFTIYSEDSRDSQITFGLMQNFYPRNILNGKEYTLKPGKNVLTYNIDNKSVPYSADLNSIEGVYFKFENQHSRNLEDAPIFYLDDVKLIRAEEVKIFVDEAGIGSCNQKFTLPGTKVYSKDKGVSVDKRVFYVSENGEDEIEVTGGAFFPRNEGEYVYRVKATDSVGKVISETKKIYVEGALQHNMLENFNNAKDYNFYKFSGGNVTVEKSIVNTISVNGRDETEVDGESPNGYMLKVTLSNVKNWRDGVYTRFNGEMLDAKIAKYDYVNIRLYIDNGTNVWEKGTGNTAFGTTKIENQNYASGGNDANQLVVARRNGWYTVTLDKGKWDSETCFYIANYWGVELSSFTVYFDEITGGYYDFDISGGAQHFDSTEGINIYNNVGADFKAEIVDTIEGASAEDLAQICGNMMKVSFKGGLPGGASENYNGFWSQFNSVLFNNLKANYDRVRLRFYVKFNGEIPSGTKIKAGRAIGAHETGMYWSYINWRFDDDHDPITESGWYTMNFSKADLEEMGNVAWFFYTNNTVDVTFYFDEMDGNGEVIEIEEVDLLTKTGLTAAELSGTYLEKADGTIVVLTAEQLQHFIPSEQGKLVLSINVKDYAETEIEIKIV